MSQSHSVSIIIPAYNADRFIVAAIDSVRADLPTAQIVVVDDASADNTADVVLSHCRADSCVELVERAENGGPAAARNTGLEYATGNLIGMLDADDCYAPGSLLSMVQRMADQPSSDVVMGLVQSMHSRDGSMSPDSFDLSGEPARIYGLVSILARRTLFHRIPLNADIRHGEDIDWFMRIQEAKCTIDLLDLVVCQHRRHDRNMSDTEVSGGSEIAEVIAASVMRRRKLALERGVKVTDIYYVPLDQRRMT